MELQIIRLLIDAGLVVLIWIIQLVVYPSFLFYRKTDLIEWHKKYTVAISYIVIPLMLSQLAIALQQIIINFDVFTSMYLLLILCNWGITFLIFVPLHAKISKGAYNNATLKKLVDYNWLRVVIWTATVVLSMITN